MLHAVTCGVLCQKQVSRAGSSNYIPQHLWDVITCCCPWYILPSQHSSAQHYPLLSVMPDDSRRSNLIFNPVRLLRINRIFFAEMIFLWRKPFLARVSISFGNKLYHAKMKYAYTKGEMQYTLQTRYQSIVNAHPSFMKTQAVRNQSIYITYIISKHPPPPPPRFKYRSPIKFPIFANNLSVDVLEPKGANSSAQSQYWLNGRHVGCVNDRKAHKPKNNVCIFLMAIETAKSERLSRNFESIIFQKKKKSAVLVCLTRAAINSTPKVS